MRRKNPNAVRGGHAAKAAGNSSEAFWEQQHDGAKAMGVLVHCAHAQPAAKILGGRLTYVAKSACDFVGLLSTGQALAAESKSAVGRLARAKIKPLQIEQLDVTARVGGAAYLLVEFRNVSVTQWLDAKARRRFAISWLSVPWRKLRSALSIGLEDMLPAWEVHPGECYLVRGRLMPVVTHGRCRRHARE